MTEERRLELGKTYNIEHIEKMTFECFKKVYAGKLKDTDIKALYEELAGRKVDAKHTFAHLDKDTTDKLKGLGYSKEDWIRFDPAKPEMLIRKKIGKVAHDEGEAEKERRSKLSVKQYEAEMSKK